MTATIIQVLLLAAMVALVWYFVANRRKARAKAGVKLGFLVFLAACVWAIVRPDDLTVVANWVGVSRGTDLLLYMLVLAFVFLHEDFTVKSCIGCILIGAGTLLMAL